MRLMEFLVLNAATRTLTKSTSSTLRGYQRRLFMARTVRALGPQGQNWAEREFGWSGQTIRKGEYELSSDFECIDGHMGHGQKPALFSELVDRYSNDCGWVESNRSTVSQ